METKDDGYQYYIGVDPGGNGGIAIVDSNGRHWLSYSINRGSEYAIWKSLSTCELPIIVGQSIAVIERITPSFHGTSKASMAKLYGSYRALRMALTALGIEYVAESSAVMWRSLGIKAKGKEESKTEWKQRLKRNAMELYPTLSFGLAVSDALLIARYCYNRYSGVTTDA